MVDAPQNAGPIRLTLPLSKDDVTGLKTGDIVLLSGKLVTGRDKVHKYLFHEKPDKSIIPFDLRGGVIYHCGPIITGTEGSFRMIAAGPTTSMRVETYEAGVIGEYGLRGIIGKGGMGEKTLAAMKEYGCVYMQTISGAAAYLAGRIKAVAGSWMMDEFGAPEAMWLLEIEDFPAIITMDAHGNSLHREIEQASLENLKKAIL